MIGKVITGRSFGGCVRYVVQKKDAVVLDAAGVRMQQVNQIINDFNMQRKYNPDLGLTVGHLVLSWSKYDLDKLNDEIMVSMAKEYMQRMKIADTQYLIVKHKDTENPHIHIVYNRVDNNGKTITDKFQKDRNVKVSREMTDKYGFYISPGKEQVNRKQLKGEDQVKYQLYDAITSASKKVKSLDELKKVLAKQGINLIYKYKSGTKEIQGISFSKGEYKFKGSEIDRSLSYAKLSQAIEAQQAQHEKSSVDQLREAMKTYEQENSKSEALQPDYTDPETQSEYLKTIPELTFYPDRGFNISIADDVDDEAVHGRNRRRQQKTGMSR